MKRLAVSLAIVAMASLACQRADQEQGDTQAEPSVQSDTSMMHDTTTMPRDTAKM